MRLSNTAIKELKKRYKDVLMKCALLNMAVLIGILVNSPANALYIVNGTNVNLNTVENIDLTTVGTTYNTTTGILYAGAGTSAISTTGEITIGNEENPSGRAVQAHNGGSLILGDKNTTNTVTIKTDDAGYGILVLGSSGQTGANTEVYGKNISISGTVQAHTGGSVTLGDRDTTDSITINTGNDYGIMALGTNATNQNGATGEFYAKNFSVTVTGDSSEAIHVGNNTYNPTTNPENPASILIDAENINITAKGIALTAMSEGKLELIGNATIKSDKDVIVARGDAQVTINKAGDKTVKMDGDINFNYGPSTSGSPIDSSINITLFGSDSYWNGNIRKTNIDKTDNDELLKIEKGVSLTLNNGASWTATAIEENQTTEQVAVSSLTVNKGTIHSEKGNAHVKNAIINGDLTLNGTLTTVKGGTITFENGSTLTTTLDSSTVKFDGDGAVAGTINLTSLSAGTYTFMGENVDHSALSFADNTLYDITLDGDNLVVTTKAVDSIAEKTGASQQETSALVAMVAADGSGTEKGQLIADALSEAIQSGDTSKAIEAVKKTAPTTAQVTQGVAKEAAGTVARLASGRMSAVKGRSGGDITEGAGLWVQALYNHTKQNATSTNDGFKADSEGIALGVDKEVSENVTLGIGYGYMKTDVDSYGREMDVDGHNFFLYGKYQPSQWYVSSVLSYNYSKYTEKKEPMGVNLRSEYDVNSYSAQMMTGYEYQNGWTPEAGLRYLVVDADSYFDGMQRVSSDKDDVLTAVVGLKYETTRKANCVTFKPHARVALTYDVLSDNATANVLVSGGGNYRTESQRLHRLGAEADLGVTATVKNVDVTLEYNGAFRQDYTSQGGMLKLRYHF